MLWACVMILCFLVAIAGLLASSAITAAAGFLALLLAAIGGIASEVLATSRETNRLLGQVLQSKEEKRGD